MSNRKYIIEYCTDQFVRYGIRSIRMDDIAEGLGISKRTIYELFGDKETLLTECIGYHLHKREVSMDLVLSTAQNVIEEVLLFLDNAENIMKGNLHFMAELKKFHPRIYERLVIGHHERMTENMRITLEKGINEGLFIKKLNIDLAVYMLTDSLYTIMARSEANLGDKIANLSIFEAVATIVAYFLRGISTAKGMDVIEKYYMAKIDSSNTND